MRTLLKKLSTALLLGVSMLGMGQNDYAPMTQYSILEDNRNECLDILETPDHHVLILSSHSSLLSNSNERGVFLSKRDRFSGALIWEQSYQSINGIHKTVSMEKVADGYILVGYSTGTDFINRGGKDGLILKVDFSGNLIWSKTFGGNFDDEFFNTKPTQDGGYILCGQTTSAIGDSINTRGGNDAWVVKLDGSGNLIWSKTFGGTQNETANSLIVNNDNSYTLVGTTNSITSGVITGDHSNGDGWIFKISNTGSLIWQKYQIAPIYSGGDALSNPKLLSFDDIKKHNNQYILAGISHSLSIGLNSLRVENNLFSFDLSGNLIWHTNRFFSFANMNYISLKYSKASLRIDSNDDYLFTTIGEYLSNGGQPYTYSSYTKTAKSVGALKGILFLDNDDCVKQSNELAWANKLVKATLGSTDYFGQTDIDGRFSIPVGQTGTFNISPVHEWFSGHPACYTGTSITTTATNPSADNLEIPVKILYNCPSLEVSNTAPYLRRCFNNTYYVNYKNTGFAAANNSYIDITLDPVMTFVSSSIPSTDLGNGVRRFNLGTVNGESQGYFNYTVYLACGDSTILGQTHCVEAHIYPDSACIPVPDTANIVVSSACEGDSIVFRIQNRGTENSPQLRYYVYEDIVLEYQGQTPAIAPNQVIEIRRRNNGQSTYRLETTNPIASTPYGRLWGASIPSSSIEGCGATGSFNTGFVTLFSTPDDQPWLDLDCQENVNSYDPNDKTGYPLGIGTNHYITANDAIEYKIRFQNTGTDTAFTVIIRDTLDADLNPSTIEFGASSHPYTAQLYGAGVLKFTFNAINLPDSNVNESASHGFVSFKIWQKTNNPVGTLINNTASIYFDFNAPIVTNTTHHEINHQNRAFFVGIEENKSASLVGIQVFPNPFEESATMIIGDEKLDHFTVNIYNLAGQVVQSQSYENTNQATIYRNNLTQGIYIYQIEQKGQILNIGKVLIK